MTGSETVAYREEIVRGAALRGLLLVNPATGIARAKAIELMCPACRGDMETWRLESPSNANLVHKLAVCPPTRCGAAFWLKTVWISEPAELLERPGPADPDN